MRVKNFLIGALNLLWFFSIGLGEFRANSGLQDSLNIKDFNNKEFTVIFVFGQSNSSNYGQTKYESKKEVYNWYGGKIFKAKDPLQGADGNRGSAWGRLGDKLIESHLAQKVLLVPLGIGSTTVADWSEGGIHHEKILSTLEKLEEQGIIIDFILWHQGESDNFENTSTADYIKSFEAIRTAFLRNDVIAPIFMSIASYHPNENSLNNKKLGCDPNIQDAQKALIEKYPDIFAGANTDELDKSYYRYDGIHLSVIGLIKHVEMWLDIFRTFLNRRK